MLGQEPAFPWVLAHRSTNHCGLGREAEWSKLDRMSIQQLLISEVSQQPEPLLREVWHYLNFLKSKAEEDSVSISAPRPGFGSVPGIELAEDFDAPLDAFADYRP